MARPISIRLDDEAADALESLTKSGRSRSAAVREALVELASKQGRQDLAAEVSRLNADKRDRAEKRAIGELMESLRAAR